MTNLFEDNDFPYDNLPDNFKNAETHWIRPHQISKIVNGRIGSPGKPVFINQDLSAFDINQGAVGDCWFLGSIPLVLNNKKIINKVLCCDENLNLNSFEEGKYDGKFVFQFYHFDEWVKVEIDDRLPCQQWFGKYYAPRATKVSDDVEELAATDDANCEYWVALLEKAYAKFKGGYKNIESGNSWEALANLIGSVGQSISVSKMLEKLGSVSVSKLAQLTDSDHGKLFSHLLHLNDTGALMTCSYQMGEYQQHNSLGPATWGSDGFLKVQGIIPGHCYTLLGFYQAFGDKLLVKLYNPHGKGECTLAGFSDDSDIWKNNPEETKRLKHRLGDDGAFFMTIQDWVKLFSEVNISYRRKEFMTEKEFENNQYYFESYKDKNIQMKKGESQPRLLSDKENYDSLEFEVDDNLLQIHEKKAIKMLVSYKIKDIRLDQLSQTTTGFYVDKYDETYQKWRTLGRTDMCRDSNYLHIIINDAAKYRVVPYPFYTLQQDVEGYCSVWIKNEKEAKDHVDPVDKKRDELELKLKLKMDELKDLEEEIGEIEDQINKL